jgi:nucleotide-binding universal stress UspA family protein
MVSIAHGMSPFSEHMYSDGLERKRKTMFKRILVPLDGSALAERAFHVAARIAHATEGSIVAGRVVTPPGDFWPLSTPLLPSATAQNITETGRAEANNYLRHLVQSNHLAGIEVNVEVQVGPAAATLLSLARSENADLIVMCSHGSTASTRWGLGSVAEKVTRHAPVPVLVLPDKFQVSEFAGRHSRHYLSGLVSLDGSAVAEAALIPASRLIAALTAPAQAVLHLILIATLPAISGRKEPPAALDPGMEVYLQRETEVYLRSIIDRFHMNPLAEHQILITSSLTFSSDVADTLVKIAENGEDKDTYTGGFNLIVMTTHGRGGMRYWTLGNVTLRVLSATNVPLLMVPPLRYELSSDTAVPIQESEWLLI